MPKKLSAGILLYRRHLGRLQVFLAHPGGPFWAKKDEGAWTIPKGEYLQGEDPLAVARREFAEETGCEVAGAFRPLASLKQPSGKLISAWAVEGEIDPATLKSNTFPLEWPPRSGKMQQFPEVDRGAWFDLSTAHEKIQSGQRGFLQELQALVGGATG
ncbi:MAG TPA: NUDIX domain-containing protein [Nitrospiraceae bacterium]|jgi:predicted NUDIX family NTP pyrophosphohydrolase|nr:NUDIX domain-containing protein [Nitrospiraceae bacterium]